MNSVLADAIERVKQMTPKEFQRIEKEKGLSIKEVKPMYKYELILNKSMPSTILHHSILFTEQEILDICTAQKKKILALKALWDKEIWYTVNETTFEALYDEYLDRHNTHFNLKIFPRQVVKILKEDYGFITLPEPPADVTIYF